MAGKPTPCPAQREQIGSADTRDPLAQHGGVAGHSPPMHSPGVPRSSERTPAFCRASAPSFTSTATASLREPRCGSCRTEAPAGQRPAGPCTSWQGHRSAPEGSCKSKSLRLVFSRHLSVSRSHQSRTQPSPGDSRDATGQGTMPGQVPGSWAFCLSHPIPQAPVSLSRLHLIFSASFPSAQSTLQ